MVNKNDTASLLLQLYYSTHFNESTGCADASLNASLLCAVYYYTHTRPKYPDQTLIIGASLSEPTLIATMRKFMYLCMYVCGNTLSTCSLRMLSMVCMTFRDFSSSE